MIAQQNQRQILVELVRMIYGVNLDARYWRRRGGKRWRHAVRAAATGGILDQLASSLRATVQQLHAQIERMDISRASGSDLDLWAEMITKGEIERLTIGTKVEV